MHLLNRWKKMAAILAAATLAAVFAAPAQAVPSYARQTGADCGACHVGGFGPQMTPYGMKFKMGGYTETDGQDSKIPLSAMITANWTKTAKNVADGDKAASYFTPNNNAVIQETSLFVAGRMTDNIGTFIQQTYSGIDRKAQLDQFDIRYARSLQIGGKETTIGLSLNGNPTLTDPFNTLAQWRFPYTKSGFSTNTGPTTPMIENLAGSVVGANAYAFFDNSIYAEFGLYDKLSHGASRAANTGTLAMADGSDAKFKNPASYWRLAYFKDMKKDNFSIGLVGLNADLQNSVDGGATDKYRDIGVDASYQFLGNRQHIFTVNGSYMREKQTLDYSLGAGAADNQKNTLNQLRIATSYNYNQTWGATAGLFQTKGTADAAVYGSSLNGKPNTSGYMLQADWTPWGKENSWAAPYANVRIGVQYIGYSKFMGGSTYLNGDGVERNAKDNNTLSLFLWTSI